MFVNWQDYTEMHGQQDIKFKKYSRNEYEVG